MTTKPNFAGTVRKVLQGLNYTVTNKILSDARKGHQRVKVQGVKLRNLDEVKRALHTQFGDNLKSVHYSIFGSHDLVVEITR